MDEAKTNAPVVRDRRRFLGGSDAAAVMGLSPWKTRVQLWMDKTGRSEPVAVDLARKKRFARGHKLEPFIRDMTTDRLAELGVRSEVIEVNAIYTDPEHPFLACEIDFELRLWGELEINGVAYVFDGEHVNCDAKSVAGFAAKKWGEEFTEDVPVEYAAQFMHGLMITGRRLCLAAALRTFDDVDLYWTVRDDETIAAMRTREVDFWVNHVQADAPPEITSAADVQLLFPKDNSQSIEATDEIAEKVRLLNAIEASISAHELEAEKLKVDIVEFMKPNSEIRLGPVPIVTWKAQDTKRVHVDTLKTLQLYSLDAESGNYMPADAYALACKTSSTRVLRLPAKGKALLAARARDAETA